MAEHVVDIATAGSDVFTTPDKDLAFSSRYQGFRILTHGSLTTAGTVAHGLGYIPAFLNYKAVSAGTYQIENNVNLVSALGNSVVTNTAVSFPEDNNFYFIFTNRLQ